MCTVTLVPHDGGVRVMCNRDERLTRPPALAPRIFQIDGRPAVYPIDPVSGGTWVAANEAGLVLALLNRTVTPGWRASQPGLSRGLIVPRLAGAGSPEEALTRALDLDASRFDLFRLLVAGAGAAVLLTSDGRTLTAQRLDIGRPVMLTSSSLGDRLVEAPRRRLFRRLVLGERRSPLGAQDQFHRHQWPSQRAISVCMEREDARTVSRTVIEVGRRTVSMRYEDLATPTSGHAAAGQESAA